MPPGTHWPFAGPREANKRLAVVMGSGDRFAGSPTEPEPGFQNFVPGGVECIQALYPENSQQYQSQNEVTATTIVHNANLKTITDPADGMDVDMKVVNSDSDSSSTNSEEDSSESDSSDSSSTESSETSDDHDDAIMGTTPLPAMSSQSSQQQSLDCVPDFLKTPPKQSHRSILSNNKSINKSKPRKEKKQNC